MAGGCLIRLFPWRTYFGPSQGPEGVGLGEAGGPGCESRSCRGCPGRWREAVEVVVEVDLELLRVVAGLQVAEVNWEVL